MLRAAGRKMESRLGSVYWRLKRPDLARSLAISSHLTPRERAELFDLSRAPGLQSIVEIGAYLGASAAAMGAGLMRAGNEAARIYCVDTWNNDAMTEGQRDTFRAFSDNTAPYARWIVPVRGWSGDVAPAIARQAGRIDLLFIDGDHSYEGCLGDWLAYGGLMSSGGRVVFHDVGWADGVQRVIEEVVRPRVRMERRLPNLWWGEVA